MYDDEVRNMQQSINSGMCWKLEGAAGREAMAFIEAGYCTLGPKRTTGGYGNTIGSRTDVVVGTKGSIEYSRDRQPDFWENRADDWAD
jgi:hypothetical protein